LGFFVILKKLPYILKPKGAEYLHSVVNSQDTLHSENIRKNKTNGEDAEKGFCKLLVGIRSPNKRNQQEMKFSSKND